MTISFVSIFTFVWILENKSREPLKTRQYVTAETLTRDLFPLKYSRDAGGEHRPERPESVVIRHIEMPGHPTDMSHQ